MKKPAKILIPLPPPQKESKFKRKTAFRRYARLSREELADLIDVTLQMKELNPSAKNPAR
jgi:hypothetical protein